MISFGKSSNNLTNLTSAPARFFYFSNPPQGFALVATWQARGGRSPCWAVTNALQDFNVCQFFLFILLILSISLFYECIILI